MSGVGIRLGVVRPRGATGNARKSGSKTNINDSFSGARGRANDTASGVKSEIVAVPELHATDRAASVLGLANGSYVVVDLENSGKNSSRGAHKNDFAKHKDQTEPVPQICSVFRLWKVTNASKQKPDFCVSFGDSAGAESQAKHGTDVG